MVFTKVKTILALSFVALALAAPPPASEGGDASVAGGGLNSVNGLGGTLGGTLGFIDGVIEGGLAGGPEEAIHGATNGLGGV
ncbi:hypothetical protein BJV74DRAFT_874709 [Russula compacta]|nr:hypothetical protein BJV74DRAFT_874709 [Russula compacta]